MVSINGNPDIVGQWTHWINKLPDGKLPSAPLLGNGHLGVALNTKTPSLNANQYGPGQLNALDIWHGSNSMWSCIHCGGFAGGCCSRVALGGVSIIQSSTFDSPQWAFMAEQRIGPAQLYTSWQTKEGSLFETLTYMDPKENIVVTNCTWKPKGSDPEVIDLDIATWVLGGSAPGPVPKSIGCANAVGNQIDCNHLIHNTTIQFVSRSAVNDSKSSPHSIWAALATTIVGGSTISSKVTRAKEAWEVKTRVQINAKSILSVVTVESETATAADPSQNSINRMVKALKPFALSSISDIAEQWWNAYWKKSSISLIGNPELEHMWHGAQYILACAASTNASVPAPGLYGPWVTTDNPSWKGDYTLDYNYEATFYGAFGSNHPEQTVSYFPPIIEWMSAASKEAQSEASKAHVNCTASALHYACHLAPWGMQSRDQTVYMHWNGAFAALLFINHFEYTRDIAFAKEYTYPLINGLNSWWRCFLKRTEIGIDKNKYIYEDVNQWNPDNQHENQKVPNPQIGISFIKRLTSFQLKLAKILDVQPPDYIKDIHDNLVEFNTYDHDHHFTFWDNTRCFKDSGWLAKAKTPEECAMYCGEDASCSIFSFCPNSSVSGCDQPPECFRYTLDKESMCNHSWSGWTSGIRDAGLTKGEIVWTAYTNATIKQSDMFSMYPIWPTEYYSSSESKDVLQIAQGSSKIYSNFPHGRPVELFPAAVRAGACSNQNTLCWTAEEIVNGLKAFIKNDFGPNLLLYAPGGGVENVGVTRAINEMLLQAPNGQYIHLFPTWPKNQSAAFSGFLTKGGFVVSAIYNGTKQQVENNVEITAVYTSGSDDTSPCSMIMPWKSQKNVAVVCGGTKVKITWNADQLSFDAPIGKKCIVSGASHIIDH